MFSKMIENMVYIVDILLLILILVWYNKERIDVLEGFKVYDGRRGVKELIYIYVIWGVFKILNIVLLTMKYGFNIRMYSVVLNVAIITLLITILGIKLHSKWMGDVFIKKMDEKFNQYKKIQYTYYYVTVGSVLVLGLILVIGLQLNIESLLLIIYLTIIVTYLTNYLVGRIGMKGLNNVSEAEVQRRVKRYNDLVKKGEYLKVGDSFLTRTNKKVNKVYKAFKDKEE